MLHKHIAYYRVLEAFDVPDCPICNLVKESLRQRTESLFYEQVNDPGTRRKLVQSQGFCAAHSQTVLELGNPLGVAIIYRDIIDAVSDELSKGIRLRKPAKRAKCPACVWAENDERQYLSVLAEHFAEEEMHSRIAGCRGFCLPHLKKLLQLLSSDHQSEFQHTVLSHLAELKTELSDIVRKSDYRCKESFGPEGDAWIRTVIKLSGCSKSLK